MMRGAAGSPQPPSPSAVLQRESSLAGLVANRGRTLCRSKRDAAIADHSAVLVSWSPLTRQSGKAGPGARRTIPRGRAGRWATNHSASEFRLAGKLWGIRGADGGAVARTRIFAGQQMVRETPILIVQHRGFVCMPPPWLEHVDSDRSTKPDSLVASSLDALSGVHLTIHSTSLCSVA